MKILLCNVPIRAETASFPPVACTTLYNTLSEAGYKPFFYDIDAKRPSFNELSNFFKAEQFDIVGISTVVSTGYQYTKKLSDIIRKASPKTQIILGGNLAASWEVILYKCQIDVCVIGEGERVLLNLTKHWEKYKDFKPLNKELWEIKGIAFLDSDGSPKFTGHQELSNNNEVEQPDYELLDKVSDINKYILDPMTRLDFASDPRSHQSHRREKKMATVLTSRGCVNRCTFCHRWIKGYKNTSVEKTVDIIKDLRDKYNVGFFCIAVECFGERKQWVEEFIKLIKPMDILFQIGGAKVSIVKKDPTIIHRLKEIGLVAIYFGMESGSDKILKVMEKNCSCDENIEAAKACLEAGVFTVIQLVIGMPGENEQTINETIEFIKNATGNSPLFSRLLSINYLQSLPGTPCYEFLRYHGFLGKTIEDEEQYLLRVSNMDACEFKQYINVSEEPLSKVKSWQMKIDLLSRIHWLKQQRWIFSLAKLNENEYYNVKNAGQTIISRIKLFLRHRMITYRIIDFMGDFFWKIIILRNRCSLYGIRKALLITFGLTKEDDRSRFEIEADSLRRILQSKYS